MYLQLLDTTLERMKARQHTRLFQTEPELVGWTISTVQGFSMAAKNDHLEDNNGYLFLHRLWQQLIQLSKSDLIGNSLSPSHHLELTQLQTNHKCRAPKPFDGGPLNGETEKNWI